jgi:hypothetical protein
MLVSRPGRLTPSAARTTAGQTVAAKPAATKRRKRIVLFGVSWGNGTAKGRGSSSEAGLALHQRTKRPDTHLLI